MIPGFIAALGILALLWLWFSSGPKEDFTERIPGADTKGLEVPPQVVVDASRGRLVKSDGVPANLPGAWPRYRGENFDGISVEEMTLAKKWGERGRLRRFSVDSTAQGEPKVLWGLDVGEGYAGAAILNGRVYMLDYDFKEQANALRCLSLADGKEIWRYSYPIKLKRNYGMSRTVPAVTEKYVVTLGPKCHVTCSDSTTGEFLWALDLVKDFNTKVPPWYAGQCPLIDGESVILAPGGEALMIAVDAKTGEVIWKTPNPHGWNMTHSSIIPMELKGRRMYIYCASGGVVGVSADDGSILWETTDWTVSIANIPAPLIIGEDLSSNEVKGRIFLSGGYDAGSMMLQVKDVRGLNPRTNGKRISTEDYPYVATPLFRLKPKVFGAALHTPILFNGYIYGVRPDGQFVCLNTNGELIWTSGASHRFGRGPYMIVNPSGRAQAGGLIYVMNDTGLLTLLEATPAGYKQLAQSQVLTGDDDSWGPMALVGGRFILRDMTRMVCLDVRGK